MAAVTVIVTSLVTAFGHSPLSAWAFGDTSPAIDVDRIWLVALWACAAASIVLCLGVDRARRRGRIARLPAAMLTTLAILGVVITLVLSTWQEESFPSPSSMWTGFGILPLALGLALAVGVLAVALSRAGRPSVWLAICIPLMCAVAVWPFVHTPGSFSTGYDNAFTLDEILAPSTGRWPGFDYIAQYSQFLGFPLSWISHAAPGAFAADPIGFAVAWMSALQILTVGVAVVVAIVLAPRRTRWIMPIIVVAFTLLPGPAGLEYFAALPLRFLLPAVLLATITLFNLRRARPDRWWWPLVIGIVAGAASMNNLDQGVPAALAGALALTASQLKLRAAARTLALYLAGMLCAPFAYVVAGSLSGHVVRPDYFLYFVSQFGVVGVNNVPMPVFGLHTGFALLGIVGGVVGFVGGRRLRGRNRALHVAIAFQSTWLLLALVYYSGRSATPTLVTGSSFLAAILLALLVSAAFPHARLLRRAGVRQWSRPDWVAAGLVILGLAIPLAAVAYLPAVLGRSAVRLAHVGEPQAEALNYLQPDPTAALAAVPDDVRLVGILGVSGSAWSVTLGIPNASVFLHPDYLALGDGARLECEYLATLPGDELLTTRELLDRIAGDPVCRAVLEPSESITLTVDTTSAARPVEWLLVPVSHEP